MSDDWGIGYVNAPPDAGTVVEPITMFGSCVDWFREWARYAYARQVDGRAVCWSAEWWSNDEAFLRIDAVWRAWEHLRLDPATGQATWWRDFFMPMLRDLTDSKGPFGKSTDLSELGQPLPHTDPPSAVIARCRDLAGGRALPVLPSQVSVRT